MAERTEMITIADAAKLTEVPSRTLRYHARKGTLQAEMYGLNWMTTIDAVEQWKQRTGWKPQRKLPDLAK